MPVPAETFVSRLTKAGLYLTRTIVYSVIDDVEADPDVFLEPVVLGKRQKKALRVDLDAEDDFYRGLRRYGNRAFRNVRFLGEERLKDTTLDLTDRSEVFALVDAVDGTDLVERGLYNWGSAVVFFAPKAEIGSRILASVVGLSNGTLYFANCETEGAFVIRKGKRKSTSICAPSGSKTLKDASVCFYGQKIKNFVSLIETGLVKNIVDAANKQRDIGFRIYNLAGIPMMMRLIDPISSEANGIDAVFDVHGQMPHDVVPGAYIARKAGATIKDLNGRLFDYRDLEATLLRPSSSRLKYVLANSESLCTELISALKSSRHMRRQK